MCLVKLLKKVLCVFFSYLLDSEPTVEEVKMKKAATPTSEATTSYEMSLLNKWKMELMVVLFLIGMVLCVCFFFDNDV